MPRVCRGGEGPTPFPLRIPLVGMKSQCHTRLQGKLGSESTWAARAAQASVDNQQSAPEFHGVPPTSRAFLCLVNVTQGSILGSLLTPTHIPWSFLPSHTLTTPNSSTFSLGGPQLQTQGQKLDSSQTVLSLTPTLNPSPRLAILLYKGLSSPCPSRLLVLSPTPDTSQRPPRKCRESRPSPEPSPCLLIFS